MRPLLNEIQNGDEVRRLEPKVMDVLCFLARHAGEVLNKERILNAVWPDTFVTDEVLTNAISQLRKAFNGNPRDSRFIQTIPRRGYRVVAEVTFDQPLNPVAENVYRFRPEPADRDEAGSERLTGVGSQSGLNIPRSRNSAKDPPPNREQQNVDRGTFTQTEQWEGAYRS